MISREGMAGKRISDSNGSGVGGEGGGGLYFRGYSMASFFTRIYHDQ